MELSAKHNKTLDALLDHEHRMIAINLGFIDEAQLEITDQLLIEAIGLIDEISRSDNELAGKVVVTVCAILWTYRKSNWDGLKDVLILTLNRVGLSPSSIMVDENFDHENNTFSSTQSLINQIAIAIHQMKHEISFGNKTFLLTNFQKRVWDKLSETKLLGISAPTSAGKSFIILLKCIDMIMQKGGNIVYIVPTLSLVAQVSADFNEQIQKFGIKGYRICTTYTTETAFHNKIYVLTQEKAISAFSQSDQPFGEIRVLIVDEIQNVEKVPFEGDQRAKTLYDVLIEFRHSSSPELTILAGPRVEGLKDLGIEIFAEEHSDEEKTKDSPVVNITYSISETKKSFHFNQYNDILKNERKIAITNDDIISGYGNVQYRDNFIEYLFAFISRLGNSSRNIIFSPTTSQARSTAVKLSALSNNVVDNPLAQSLAKYIQDTVHDEYDLYKTVTKGVVYHHGKTPTHIRSVLERAIRERIIENVVCTTTLMQGVNLPAQNVIMRNPDLAIRAINGIKPKLTPYEIANLRGRAGRLLKDLIGRTYILEENSFEREPEQTELFPEAEKSLSCGYGEKYSQHKNEINTTLNNQSILSVDDNAYGFLVTYIRQTILKHGANSRTRLLSVGIDMSDKEINSIAQSLNNILSVPKEICYKNRYWDPLDLNKMFLSKTTYDLPTGVAETNIEGKLVSVLGRLKSQFPKYYEKYFDIPQSLLYSTCISAKEWMKEKTLKEILDKPYFDTSDKIDDRISLLQREISFGLPMLLKPIYDMNAPENMFLRFIEIGAYKPIARKMIELNVPRETAITLSEQYFSSDENLESNLEDLIITRLRQRKNQMDYWIGVQIESII